jgi:leader peptidase (prepilin peptidase)/N-methyltransferase
MDPLEELIRAQPGLSFMLAALGLVVGSFLNVVIHRLPKMMEAQWAQDFADYRDEPAPDEVPLSLAYPGSQCPHCNTKIKAWQNIPVVSYALLRGHCASCEAPISLRYPLVEMVTALTWVVCGLSFDVSTALAGALLLTAVLIVLTAIDLDHQLLPDSLTLPLLWVGLLINMTGTFTSLESALLGAVFGYLSLWSVYWLFKIITGKEGMGYGDFKLLAALGAWFGLAALPTIVLLSSLVGATLGLTLILTGQQTRETPMPFGPFLAGAGLIHLLYPNALLGWITGGI